MHELDYIPLVTGKGSDPLRRGSSPPPPKRARTNSQQKRAASRKLSAREASRTRQPTTAASSSSCFVVPDGESVTLCPPWPYPQPSQLPNTGGRPNGRVNAARLVEDGWTKTDLCSRIARHPDRFAGIDMVVLYDLDNAAGWFNIWRPVPPNVLVVVFCGGGGVYGSLPRQPLIAGHVPENRLFVTVCGGGKNSADFGLTYAAGELNRIIPQDSMFAIVSNDADFKHLMSHLRKTRPNSYQIKAHAKVMAKKSTPPFPPSTSSSLPIPSVRAC